MPEARITELPSILAGLSQAEQAIFARIFHVAATTGELAAPEEMHPWIVKFFGSVEAVARQRIVKVTNLVTMEGALFNELRANRPLETEGREEVRRAVMESMGDPFCRPEAGTPADLFGRLRGAACVTASNVAKYDGFHGLVIFAAHDPLRIEREAVRDYFTTARRWAEAARAQDPAARFYFFLWNCLWKSGASIVHGHAQMTVGKEMHYARIEGLRRAACGYGERVYGEASPHYYFEDLYRAHDMLDLAWEREGVRGFAYLAPIKEKEVILLAEEEGPSLYDEVYRILDGYRRLGVESFNVALIRPPLGKAEGDWEGFPAMVRIVDRGDPNNKTADFGGMELYAASVISSDPFRVAKMYR